MPLLSKARGAHAARNHSFPKDYRILKYADEDRTSPVDVTDGFSVDVSTEPSVFIGVSGAPLRVGFLWDHPLDEPLPRFGYDIKAWEDLSAPLRRGDRTSPYDWGGGTTKANPVDLTVDPGQDSRPDYVVDGVHTLTVMFVLPDGSTFVRNVPVTVSGGGVTQPTPAVPTGLTTSVATANHLQASWTADADAVSYEVQWALSTPIPSDATVNVSLSTTWLSDFISTDTVVYWRVRSVGAGVDNVSAWSADQGPATITGAAPVTDISSPTWFVPYDGSTPNGASIIAGRRKGSRALEDTSSSNPSDGNYSPNHPHFYDNTKFSGGRTFDDDVVWPTCGWFWTFVTKNQPSGWANSATKSMQAAVTRYAQERASGFIRNSQLPENGGFGSTADGFTSDAPYGGVFAIMASPRKQNARNANAVLAALEMARMADGQYWDELAAVGTRIQTSTEGGLSAGEWAERFVVALANECNAAWFANYNGINQGLIGDPDLLNPPGDITDPAVRQALINLASPGNPGFERFEPDPALANDTSGKKQVAIGDDTDAGLGGDLSVIFAMACLKMIEALRSTCPGVITTINYAHSGADPDPSGSSDLERTINWRTYRLIVEPNALVAGVGVTPHRDNLCNIDVDAYARSSFAAVYSGSGSSNDWRNYEVTNPGGAEEFAHEIEAAIAHFKKPFASREWGIGMKLTPGSAGVGKSDPAVAKIIDYFENPVYGKLNHWPVHYIMYYHAVNQPQSNRRLRYHPRYQQPFAPHWTENDSNVKERMTVCRGTGDMAPPA